MSNRPLITIDPDVMNHPLVGAGQPVKPADPTRGSFSRMESWFWLICAARFEPGSVVNKGHRMTLDRGEIMASYPFMATTWNWTVDTVREWIRRLIEDEMLAKRLPGFAISEGMDAAATLRNGNMSVNGSYMQLPRNDRETTAKHPRQITNRVQVISVCNYSRFQVQKWEVSQANSQANPRPAPAEPQANPRNLSIDRKEERNIDSKQHGLPMTPRTDDVVEKAVSWKHVAAAISDATADMACGDLSRDPNLDATTSVLVTLVNKGGCNLDLDVIPTIRRILSASLVKTGKVAKSWSYYEAPIKDARDKRLRLEATAHRPAINGSPRANGAGHIPNAAESEIIAREYEDRKAWERDNPEEIKRQRQLGLR